MITDYFFDVRLREKYDKIAEEKFGSKFICYALQYKEEFEEYDKNLKIFKYLFSLGDEARIYLWNTIASSSLFDDIYKNIERNDFTKEEFALFENINNTFKELKTYRRLNAEKNEDKWVSVEIYDNIDDAKKVYSDLMSDIDDELSVYRDGKVVIYGTKSAVNDARSK